MGSKRAKLMVSLAQNLPICTEDNIEIGSLETLNNFVQSDCDGPELICSELEVPTVPPEGQETTDGGFLKVSSINCDGFRIQPDEENKNTHMIFYQNEKLGELDDVASLLENTTDSQLLQNNLCFDSSDGNIDIQHSELQQTDIDFEISSNQNNDGDDAENRSGSQSSNIGKKTLTEDDTSSLTTAIILDHNQNTERLTKKGTIRKRQSFAATLDSRKRQKYEQVREKHNVRQPCDIAKCKKKCQQKIQEERRAEINKMYWDLNWFEKKTYVLNCITRTDVKRRRSCEFIIKKNSLKYSFKDSEGENQNVCKIFFLTTLGYKKNNDWPIQSFVKKNVFQKRQIVPEKDKRGRHLSHTKIATDNIERHIELFNPTISHYRREHAPKRLYLPSDLSIHLMHKDYIEKHPTNNCSYEVYRKVVKSKNISFTKLGNEECETCEGFQLHDTTHSKDNLNESCEICKNWSKHINKAKLSRELYRKDAEANSSPDTIKVSADLEKVIMLPRIDMFKKVIFTQRIVVYNESFVPLGKSRSRKPYAALWREAISGRSKEDIISTFYAFFLHNRDSEHFVLWLDNCSSQNKNWSFLSFLVYIINSNKLSAKDIVINYFEPGHSFMSADSFHHQVELSLKRIKKVYDFYDFIEAVKKSNSGHVDVKEMMVSDFREWNDFSSQTKLKRVCPRIYLNGISKIIAEKGSFTLKVKTEDGMQDLDFLQVKIMKNGFSGEPNSINAPCGVSKTKKENILKT